MATSPGDAPTGSVAKSAANGNGRLDSWKEIAAHLGRSVRTVQNWEKREGLPVHRLHHKERGSVYAFASELDAWWEERREGLDADQAHAATSNPATPRAPVGRLAGAVLVTVIVILAIYAFVHRSFPAKEDALVLRRLPDPGNYRFMGRPSADGRYLSYSDVNGDVAVFDSGSGEGRAITNKIKESPDTAYTSAMSPDGAQVAFAWQHWPERYMDLRLVDADGGNPRMLHHREAVREIPSISWAANGAHLVAQLATEDGSRVAVVSVLDHSIRFVSGLDDVPTSGVSLSPDARYLAYGGPSSEEDASHDVWSLEIESGRRTLVASGPSNDSHPLWSADGTRIVFRSDRSGSSHGVWVVRIENGIAIEPPRLVRKDMGHFEPLALLDDGTYVYDLQAGASDVFVDAIHGESGRVAGRPERISGGGPDGLNALASAWSRDGSQLAYQARGSDRDDVLVIRSMESADTVEIRPGLRLAPRPQWGADDHSLLVSGWDDDGRRRLFRIDLEGGPVEALIGGQAAGSFDVTEDGARLFYTSGTQGDVHVYDISTGRGVPLYGSGIFGKIAISPDGRWLACARRAETLLLVPTAGGEPRALWIADNEGLLVQDWTRDGQFLLFTRWKEGQEPSLWRIAAEGGEPEPLGLQRDGLREVRLHPEGDRIAYTAGEPHSELWAMENFLPARPNDELARVDANALERP